MKRILAMSVLGLSLLGGIASADRFEARGGVTVRVPAPVVTVHTRGEARVYRDYHHRPALRYERMGAHRRGFTWVRGEWSWSGAEWTWVPGHYVRVRAW